MRNIKSRDALSGSRIRGGKSDATEKSPEQQPPVFSFEYVQRSHCISLMEDRADRGLLLDALHTLGSMTWSQINSAPRHGLGYEKMPMDKMKAKRPSCVTDDVNLLVFRWKGKLPFVGFRDGRIFNILWIERSFGDLYDHS